MQKKGYEQFEDRVRKVDRGIVPPSRSLYKGAIQRRRPLWQTIYSRVVAGTDTIVISLVVFGAQIFWLPRNYPLILAPVRENTHISYFLVSGIIVALWMCALFFLRSYDPHVLATGDEEYARVIRASLVAFMLVSAIAYWTKTELARGYVLIAFPVGLILLVVARWMARRWLARQWRNGKMRLSVMVIGQGEALSTILDNLIKAPGTPYDVVGVCDTISSDRPIEKTKVSDQTFFLLPYREDVSDQLTEIGAEIVVIVPGPLSTPERIRRIGWQLDQTTQQMYLAPGLTDVAGPRISVRPAAGMPLMSVEPAGLSRLARLSKRLFDLVVSLVIIILFSPVLIVTAILVKITDWGPVFYQQERIGFLGRPFFIWKFRSMRVNADKLEVSMIAEGDAGNEVQFKMKDDPRITPIGKFIRRYSIDELPQLFNVLNGSMSLIGPRPHQAREVELYEDEVYRRFLVKPGITGLWQVSGRSNLTWDESVRMDLYYVENWEFIDDIRILWRTAKAVLDGDGAY